MREAQKPSARTSMASLLDQTFAPRVSQYFLGTCVLLSSYMYASDVKYICFPSACVRSSRVSMAPGLSGVVSPLNSASRTHRFIVDARIRGT